MLRKNYIIIPLITIGIALLGSLFSGQGMVWYGSELVRPDLTPPRWVFPLAWNIIFILSAVAAILVYNAFTKKNRKLALILFIINAGLNVAWSLLFFTLHLISWALVEMIVLWLVLLAQLIINWRIGKWSSVLLWPYWLWVSFATYLTYLILVLN
jgi:tryptophan-rich sensory protein